MAKITVLKNEITTSTFNDEDYISITDIAKFKDNAEANDIIRNWLRNRNTIKFLGIWKQLNNPSSKPIEFDGFRKEAGLNSFTMSPTKWIKSTNAIGIISKLGRNGKYFNAEIEKLDKWADDQLLSAEKELKELRKEISSKRTQSKTAPTQQKLKMDTRNLEAADIIFAKRSEIINTLAQNLNQGMHEEELFTIRWRVV